MASRHVDMGHRPPSKDRQKRTERFRVIIDAEKLEKHTYVKCRNLHIFPKKDRGALPTRMMNEASDILADIMDANDMNLQIDEERTLRRQLQRHALRQCRLLIHHIEMTHDLTALDDDSFAYWVKLANDVRNQVAAWLKSDKSR